MQLTREDIELEIQRLELEKELVAQTEKAKNARLANMQQAALSFATGDILGGSIRYSTAVLGTDKMNTAISNGITPRKNTETFDVDETTLAKYEKLNEEIRTWNDYTEEGIKLLEQKYNESQTYLNALEAERDSLGKQRNEYQQNAERYEFLSNKKAIGIELSKSEEEELKNLEKMLAHTKLLPMNLGHISKQLMNLAKNQKKPMIILKI